ncbi:hypothetical protein V4F39_03080 [Aquincola sp. MAHUQ-54]|uniref:DUF1508 domain-containing protein n=1 Tax=Aquincola agrisoli TaxID=3119538 RepID=A0AAW9Q0K8_9BURK
MPSKFLVTRRPADSYVYALTARNGETILHSDAGHGSVESATSSIERLREAVARPEAIEVRRSLGGHWYFLVRDGEHVLGRSRPYPWRSRLDKAMVAVRQCAPASRIEVDPLD